eukprot:1620156-Pleurochrysis_carterae.AAC.3
MHGAPSGCKAAPSTCTQKSSSCVYVVSALICRDCNGRDANVNCARSIVVLTRGRRKEMTDATGKAKGSQKISVD